MIYVEKKIYPNKELASLIAVNPSSSHLKRDITTQLNNMGFREGEGYTFPKRGATAINWVPQTPKEKIPYLCSLLGVDSRVDAFNFATFVYCLEEEEDFNYRPWGERAQWFKDAYGIEVAESTLRKWTYKLIREDTLIKDTDTWVWWKSESFNGEVIRTELEDDDPQLQEYKEFNKEFWNREEIKAMSKKESGKIWFAECWGKFGCKFYKCCGFTFGAWHQELIEELVEATREYLGGNE